MSAFCPACNTFVEDFREGGHRKRRKRARCPNCSALERHRLLSLLLDGVGPSIATTGSVLDIGPSRYTTRRLMDLDPHRYVRIDLDPDADARDVDAQASLTHLPFPDNAFDLIVCLHVLEHIPDDAKAMAELARVLVPGGLAIVQVPIAGDRVTDEDPDASAEERLERFGQEDHVRLYGHDFESRLSDAGLRGIRVTADLLVGSGPARYVGIPPNEPMWLLQPSGGSTLGVGVTDADLTNTLQGLLTRLIELEREVGSLRATAKKTRRQRDEAQRALDRYRSQPVIRLLRLLRRAVRRVASRIQRPRRR